MILCKQNLVLIGLFVFKILSKNSILMSIMGHNSVANYRNSNSSKLSWMSSIPARMKKIQFKIKTLERSQDYKSMWIFPDAQGQVTLQSMVGSGQISNSSKTLWLSSLPAKNEKDPIKNEGARVFTTLYSNFSDEQGQITLELVVVSGRNLNSFKLLCMSSLSARMRMVESKMKAIECKQDLSHYKSMGIFFRCPRAANSALLGPIWPNFELVLEFMGVLVT